MKKRCIVCGQKLKFIEIVDEIRKGIWNFCDKNL